MPLDGLPWAKPSSQALCCGSESWPWTLSIARAESMIDENVCWTENKVNHFFTEIGSSSPLILSSSSLKNVFALHLISDKVEQLFCFYFRVSSGRSISTQAMRSRSNHCPWPGFHRLFREAMETNTCHSMLWSFCCPLQWDKWVENSRKT